MMLRYQTS